jgi:glutamine---fructose-6-phosphate transaminase (isomerizing)
MCGIVGYIGKNKANDYLLDGLETLEYRGYDSAGISILSSDGLIKTTKVVGRIEHLRKKLEEESSKNSKQEASPRASQSSTETARSSSVCHVGIGHTRWATHGGVLVKNSHPHTDNDNHFTVVHNGIIENYQEIKTLLSKHGYIFHSDTDTEVIPILLAFNYSKLKNVEKAFIATIQALHGAYAIVMTTTHDSDSLYAAKLSSPLAIGVGVNELFIGSDALPIVSHTKQIVFMEDNEIAIVKKDGYRLINSKTEQVIDRPAELIELEEAAADIGLYPDFMSKEIHEAPQTVRSAMLGRLKIDEGIIKLGGLDLVTDQLRYIDRIIILACGTSYYAAMVGEYLLEEIAGIPVEVQQASEFRYRDEPLSRSTAVLVISQSGETADSIAALKKLDDSGILRLGIVNAPGSTLSRMTDAGVYCHAGPEKAVASTKAFVAQVTVLLLISLYLSKNYRHYKTLTHELNNLPKQLETILEQENVIANIAKKYAHHKDFLYIGRRYAYPVALEGALKIKEISYIHAEGFAGGEMKHGPLALIDSNFPTFAIALTNDLAEKSMSNMQEIKARGGPLIALIDDKDAEVAQLADDVIVIPKVAEQLQPILAAVVTHIFAYNAAKELKRDIDKPRNLAKSVTVE